MEFFAKYTTRSPNEQTNPRKSWKEYIRVRNMKVDFNNLIEFEIYWNNQSLYKWIPRSPAQQLDGHNSHSRNPESQLLRTTSIFSPNLTIQVYTPAFHKIIIYNSRNISAYESWDAYKYVNFKLLLFFFFVMILNSFHFFNKQPFLSQDDR